MFWLLTTSRQGNNMQIWTLNPWYSIASVVVFRNKFWLNRYPSAFGTLDRQWDSINLKSEETLLASFLILNPLESKDWMLGHVFLFFFFLFFLTETPCFVSCSSIQKLKEDYVKELLVTTQGTIQLVNTSAVSQRANLAKRFRRASNQ